jgi:hypothetical protein
MMDYVRRILVVVCIPFIAAVVDCGDNGDFFCAQII